MKHIDSILLYLSTRRDHIDCTTYVYDPDRDTRLSIIDCTSLPQQTAPEDAGMYDTCRLSDDIQEVKFLTLSETLTLIGKYTK